jgi:hypothetical protein
MEHADELIQSCGSYDSLKEIRIKVPQKYQCLATVVNELELIGNQGYEEEIKQWFDEVATKIGETVAAIDAHLALRSREQTDPEQHQYACIGEGTEQMEEPFETPKLPSPTSTETKPDPAMLFLTREKARNEKDVEEYTVKAQKLIEPRGSRTRVQKLLTRAQKGYQTIFDITQKLIKELKTEEEVYEMGDQVHDIKRMVEGLEEEVDDYMGSREGDEPSVNLDRNRRVKTWDGSNSEGNNHRIESR